MDQLILLLLAELHFTKYRQSQSFKEVLPRCSKVKFSKIPDSRVPCKQLLSKLTDEAKDQFVPVVCKLVPKHHEIFSACNMFNNRLYEFVVPFLSKSKFNALQKFNF